jgi:drug/metabolite transporter (DMT)-like permease
VLAVIDAIVPYVLIALAASHVQASTSALLVSTMPLFTALFVGAADRSSLPINASLGLVIGAIGVSVLAGPSAFQPGSSDGLAMLAVLLAAASYAAAAVYSRGPLRTVDPISLSAVKFAIASAVLVPAVVLHEGAGGYAELDLLGWLGLLGIGIFVTGVARCGYVWVISVAGSVTGSLLTYIVPAAALVLGLVFMGETITWMKAMGATLIAASITCVLFGQAFVERAFFRRLAILLPVRSA